MAFPAAIPGPKRALNFTLELIRRRVIASSFELLPLTGHDAAKCQDLR